MRDEDLIWARAASNVRMLKHLVDEFAALSVQANRARGRCQEENPLKRERAQWRLQVLASSLRHVAHLAAKALDYASFEWPIDSAGPEVYRLGEE